MSRKNGHIMVFLRILAKFASAINIPVILSTVGVEMGVNKPTLPSIQAALPNVEPIDRSNMNAWEDHKFRDAVRATGRKRLVMGGIVTSNCLAVAAVSALTDGYEVMFIEDAVGDAASVQFNDPSILLENQVQHAILVVDQQERTV